MLLTSVSCASYPHGHRTRTVLGRIVSTPTVDIWTGHVMSEGNIIYEVALSDSTRSLVGMIPTANGRCPYNARPQEQLFRIEYNPHDEWAVSGDIGVPRHLVTRNSIVRCDLVARGDAGRN